MKKRIYITAFTFFGFLLQFVIHGLVERWYIGLLVRDFGTYSFGLSWEQWFFIHHLGAVILLIGGIIFGYWQGTYWWEKLYENKTS